MTLTETILNHLIELVFTIISAFIVPAIFAWIRSKVHNEKLASMLADVENAVIKSVDYVEQTYVTEMKNADSWGTDAQKIAMGTAVDNAMQMLLESTKRMILDNGLDIKEYLISNIEAYIQSKK